MVHCPQKWLVVQDEGGGGGGVGGGGFKLVSNPVSVTQCTAVKKN